MAFALAVIISTAVYAKDKPATPTFDQQYEAQVLKTNAALRTFTDTSCTATEFPAATDALKTELTTLNSLYKTIPDSEDILVQAHETELYIGLVTIATQAADDQLDCEHQSAPTEQDSHSTKS